LEETLFTDSLTPSKEPATASGASAAFKGDEPLALEAPGPLEEFNLTSMEGYTASARPTDLPQSTTPLSPYTQVTEYYRQECLCHVVRVPHSLLPLYHFKKVVFHFLSTLSAVWCVSRIFQNGMQKTNDF
jgi:hypothetical protein